MKVYQDELIDEIIEMIKSNLKIMYNCSEDKLISLRNHCINKYDDKYESLPYYELVYFVKEALTDLINYPFLYDFRALE